MRKRAARSPHGWSGYRCRRRACPCRCPSASSTRKPRPQSSHEAKRANRQTNSTHVLSDPTSFEEPLIDTTISVAVDEAGGLVSVTQLGLGIVGNQNILMQCIAAAKERRSELGKRVSNTS